MLPFDQGYISYTMVLVAQTRAKMCLHFVDRPILQGWFANGWPVLFFFLFYFFFTTSSLLLLCVSVFLFPSQRMLFHGLVARCTVCPSSFARLLVQSSAVLFVSRMLVRTLTPLFAHPCRLPPPPPPPNKTGPRP